MKRDWDVIREVLLEVEGLDDATRQNFEYTIPHGEPPSADRTKAEHAVLLHRAHFLGGHDTSDMRCRALLSPELTWEGHELLDTLRSEPLWGRIKSTAKAKGLELSVDVVKGLAKVALDALLKSG